MRRAAVALVVAGLVAVGCDGGETTAEPTADVLGVRITEGGEMQTVTAEPSPTPTPSPSQAPASEPLQVASTTVTDDLNWGAVEGGGCVAIGDTLVIDEEEYVLMASVSPKVEEDCPDWSDSYDFGCGIMLQSATRHPTVMVGELTFELLVDGEVQDTWSLDVDEQVDAGDSAQIRAGGTTPIDAEGQPPVECRVTFTAA